MNERIIDGHKADQLKNDAISKASELEGEIRQILADRGKGKPLPRSDSSQVSEDVRSALSMPWADRDRSPNEFAIEDLAKRVVNDSHLLQDRGWKQDAGDTRLFATMLKQIIARAIPTLYTPNFARQAFPIRNDVNPAARTYAHHRVIKHGAMELLTPGSTDTPMVTVSAEEDERRLSSYHAGFQWSLEDLEQAAFAGVALNTEQLAALNHAAELQFELNALQGEASANTTGTYNDANIGLIAALTGTWAGATQAQILEDCRNFLHTIRTNSDDNYVPNRLIIPSSLWQYLGARNVNTDRTVRDLLLAEWPGLSIIMGSSRTDLYDVAGTGPRIMGFYFDSNLIAVVEARRLTLEPAEKRGFNYQVIGRMRMGGCSCHHPLTAGYMDGC